MQCTEFEQILELGTDVSLPAAATSHLETCSDCRLLWNDLEAIRQIGSQLGAEESAPPERVWVTLRAQLESEGLVKIILNKGAIVIIHSLSDMEEIYMVFGALAGTAASLIRYSFISQRRTRDGKKRRD